MLWVLISFIKTYVVGAHKIRLGEAILMSTHNIGFYEDLTKIIFELSSNMRLISSAACVSPSFIV